MAPQRPVPAHRSGPDGSAPAPGGPAPGQDPHRAGHDRHDPLLVSQLVAGDPLEPAQHAKAVKLVSTCAACASLAADLRAIPSLVAWEPVPPRRRDFRIDAATARSLRGTRLTRLLRRIPLPESRSLAPAAAGVMSIGLLMVVAGSVWPAQESAPLEQPALVRASGVPAEPQPPEEARPAREAQPAPEPTFVAATTIAFDEPLAEGLAEGMAESAVDTPAETQIEAGADRPDDDSVEPPPGMRSEALAGAATGGPADRGDERDLTDATNEERVGAAELGKAADAPVGAAADAIAEADRSADDEVDMRADAFAGAGSLATAAPGTDAEVESAQAGWAQRSTTEVAEELGAAIGEPEAAIEPPPSAAFRASPGPAPETLTQGAAAEPSMGAVDADAAKDVAPAALDGASRALDDEVLALREESQLETQPEPATAVTQAGGTGVDSVLIVVGAGLAMAGTVLLLMAWLSRRTKDPLLR